MNVAVLTVSDRSYSGEREDLTGPALCQSIQQLGWKLLAVAILPDDEKQIASFLLTQAHSGKIDLILTTGGTGFSSRDVTPEATLSVIDKRTSGLVEKIRIESSKINPNAILSRAEAGICGSCLIINLPGNPKGAVESLSIIAPVLPHATSVIRQSTENDPHSSV